MWPTRARPTASGWAATTVTDCHMAEMIVAPPIGDEGGSVGGGGGPAAAWVLNEGWLPRTFPNTAWELPYAMMVPPSAQATNLLVRGGILTVL